MTKAISPLERARLRQSLPTPSRRRGLRVDAGLSLEDVATMTGVSRMTVYRWESYGQSPRYAEPLEKYHRLMVLLQNVGRLMPRRSV